MMKIMAMMIVIMMMMIIIIIIIIISQGTTENSHIGHCTHTSESTNAKAQ